MATVQPAPKRGTTILTPVSANAPKTSTIDNGAHFARELHAFPPAHLDATELTPERLMQQILETHESARRSTMAMRQDPASAPCYVRGVTFANGSTASANVTVTFRHALNRPFTGLHPVRSQGAAFAGFDAPNPAGQDPSQYATVTTSVPPMTTAVHDFRLFGD